MVAIGQIGAERTLPNIEAHEGAGRTREGKSLIGGHSMGRVETKQCILFGSDGREAAFLLQGECHPTVRPSGNDEGRSGGNVVRKLVEL